MGSLPVAQSAEGEVESEGSLGAESVGYESEDKEEEKGLDIARASERETHTSPVVEYRASGDFQDHGTPVSSNTKEEYETTTVSVGASVRNGMFDAAAPSAEG